MGARMILGTDLAPTSDPLLELQFRIARRADELARAKRNNTGLNLYCWLLAEREILDTELPERGELRSG